MQKNRLAPTLALLLSGLLIGPVAATAGPARCLATSHDCPSAPAPLTCCCIAVADGEQYSLAATVIGAVNGPAARGAGGGFLVAAPPRVMFAKPSTPAPLPPTDRLALIGLLLI
jgi:hypothetical protein